MLGFVSEKFYFTKEQLYSTASYKNKNLTGITFKDVVLYYSCNFAGQNLSNSVFTYTMDSVGSSVNDADFTSANLTNVKFEGTQLVNANFSFANLTNAKFRAYYNTQGFPTFANANFSSANLTGASFYSGDLDKAIFTDAIITNIYIGSGTGFTKEQLYSTASY